MEPARLTIARSRRAQAARLSMAGLALLAWIGVVLADLFLSAMFFRDTSPETALVTSPLLAAAAWIAWMTGARGVIEVHHDRLVIRHPRVLRRPLEVPRAQVARILLDDGAGGGHVRFATGDAAEPLLWTQPVPVDQHDDRPLIGDGLLPNLAFVLAAPLAMDAARGWLGSVPLTQEIDPPRRYSAARAILVTVEDLQAARSGLAGWNVEEAGAAHVAPQPAVAARRFPADVATVLLLAGLCAAFTLENPLFSLLILAPLAVLVVMHTQARLRERGGAGPRSQGPPV